MTILTRIVIFSFIITEHSFTIAQLFEPFLFAKSSIDSVNTCTNHFIGVDVIFCSSTINDNLETKAVSDGFQMAKVSVQDCYQRINEFNLIQFKKTILIFTPENELELQALATQRRLFAINPVTYNSTLLMIVIWPSILVTKREENAFKKSLDSLAHNFLLHEYVFILYQTQLPDGSVKTTILELYSVKNITFVQNVPYLKKENELDCNIFSTTSLRRNDFRGAVITATSVESDENNPVATYSQNETVEFIEGLGVFDIWDVRDLLNFSIRAIKGSEDIAIENGTVVGIGRQLMDDEADISILHSYTLLSFVYHLTPLLPLGADRVHAFFLQPPSSSVRNIFHEPFKSDLWITLFIAWPLIIFCVFTIGLLERQLQKHYDEDEDMMWPLEETNLWAVSVIGQRSFYTNPKTMAMRIVFLSGLYMSMITFTSYSAAIISALTQETLPINSLEDLIENNFLKISDPSMFYSYFLDNEISPETHDTVDEDNYISNNDATKRIRNGGSMFLTTLDTLCLSARECNYTDKEICNTFSKVPLGKVVLTSGFYVKKRSPFKEAFNSKLIIVMERGLNSRYINNYYLSTLVKCTKKTTSYRENLGLNDVFTAFLTLCIGWGVSFTLLFLEKIFIKFRFYRYQP